MSKQIRPLPVRCYVRSEPYKSERHARLGLGEQSDHAATARQIARVLGPVPRTRRPQVSPLWRVLRALWRWL